MKTLGILVALQFVLAVIPATGQSQDPNASAAGTPAAPAAKTTPSGAAEKKPVPSKKPKKVWTNDEIGSLKGNVSVVGDKHRVESDSPEEGDQADDGSDPHAEKVRHYRDSIEQLRGQIEAADARMAQLKNFRAENTAPNGGINPNHGYNMVPLEEQVKQLEARKAKLQAQIEDLESQAEKEGIAPGELR